VVIKVICGDNIKSYEGEKACEEVLYVSGVAKRQNEHVYDGGKTFNIAQNVA